MPNPRIPRTDFLERQASAKREAAKRDLAGLLVWSRTGPSADYYGDICYLTDFNSPGASNGDNAAWSARASAALVLPVDGEPTLLIDIPYWPRDEVMVEDVRPANFIPEAVADVLKEKGLQREKLGLVGRESLLLNTFTKLERGLGGNLRYETADDILETMRSIKSEAELDCMRTAADAGAIWMTAMMESVEPGKTEAEVVADGLRAFVAAGGYPYEVIVGSGTYDQFFGTVGIPSWNTKRELKTGDLIHFDSWGPFEDYYVDICRSSVVGGKPSDAQRDLMEGVIELIAKIVAEIRPGASLLKLFEVGTTWLDENGFGSYSDTNFADVFPSFGHGLGLGVERPWITEERPWVDRNSDNRIQEGMVLAVEAALDKPGLGIAGFEQNVIVTTSGVDVYTQICPSRWWA